MSLISADELAARLADPELAAVTAVCDVRFYLTDHEQGRREYDAAHIPGAMFVDVHTDLAGTRGGGRHPLPPVADFTTLLGRLGIAPSTFVVAYDSSSGVTAGRLWWMLRSIGHGQVAVLDGGLPAWERAGHAVTADVSPRIPTEYPDTSDWTGTVDADGVAEGVALGVTLIDARAEDRFRGDEETIDKQAGHIPGAISMYYRGNLDPDGTYRPLSELAARFAGVGDSPIVYCGSGVSACHDLLALSLIGVGRARLYPGSWSEWSNDPSRPVATGD